MLLAACAGDPNPPGAANVALLLSDRTATGTTDEMAVRYTSAYVTAATAWRSAQGTRPPSDYSRLTQLFEARASATMAR